MKTKIYIGFFTFAGYDKLIIADSEENCWKAMKKEYYMCRKNWQTTDKTWTEAKDYFGYTVVAANPKNDIIEY